MIFFAENRNCYKFLIHKWIIKKNKLNSAKTWTKFYSTTQMKTHYIENKAENVDIEVMPLLNKEFEFGNAFEFLRVKSNWKILIRKDVFSNELFY